MVPFISQYKCTINESAENLQPKFTAKIDLRVMTEDLSKAVDRFISFTDIYSQHFGVPKLSSVMAAPYGENSKEGQYVETYEQFMRSLRDLSEQHERYQLQSATDEEIEQEYQEILEKLPVSKDANYSEIGESLSTLDQFKTVSILQQYLQFTVPILKSIHSKNAHYTASELNITKNLELIYGKKNKDLYTNIYRTLQGYDDSLRLADDLTNVSKELSDLYGELGPQLKRIDDLSTQIKAVKQQILEQQIDYTRVENEKQIRKDFGKLIDGWSEIVTLCSFLPTLIMCLPISWYDDKLCLSVIKQCGKVSEQFDNYLRIVGRSDISNMTIDDFVTIHLEKLSRS